MKLTIKQLIANICLGVGIYGLMKIKSYELVVAVIAVVLFCELDVLVNKEI